MDKNIKARSLAEKMSNAIGFLGHYLGLNTLSMRESSGSPYPTSSSQPLNPNNPYSPDGKFTFIKVHFNTFYEILI